MALNDFLEIFQKKNKMSSHKNGYDISNDKYKKFICFVLDNAEYFSFQLPNVNHFLVTEKNSALLLEEMKSDIAVLTDNKKENKTFVEYKNKTLPLIDIIRSQIVSVVYDVSYCDDIYNYGTEAYIVKIDDIDSCKKFLFSAKSLFSWKYPEFPEDICFIRNGKCWIRSIAHEQMLFLENITECEKEFLASIGVNYLENLVVIDP